MEKSNVEHLYEWLDQTTEKVQIEEPYLERLIVTMEALFHKTPDDKLDQETKQIVQTQLNSVQISDYETGDIRKAIQLAVLKGMRDSTQQQHIITPEAIAVLIGYLAEKLSEGRSQLSIFDPVVGTANLLTTVLEQLGDQTQAYAGEVDPTLINLGVLNANLQQKEIEFLHQDSLQPMLLDPVDMVVSDLPVGYYPDDVTAAGYELDNQDEHAYAHHLLIEQSMNYTKPGGYLIFIVPAFILESDHSDKLKAFIRSYAHIVGMLALDESAFRDSRQQKSILILQKQGENTQSPKQPLLVQLPSFKDAEAMKNVMAQMNQWFAGYQQ